MRELLPSIDWDNEGREDANDKDVDRLGVDACDDERDWNSSSVGDEAATGLESLEFGKIDCWYRDRGVMVSKCEGFW